MRNLVCLAVVLPLAMVSCGSYGADNGLEKGFACPPSESRPRTWWHWMSNFISKEGITKDLEAMARAGIGGATILDIKELKTHGSVKSLSDEWYALVQHAGREADRLGMTLSFANCPGWSSSGGPWIRPKDAMKMLGWTETRVTGGKPVSVTLPQPPAPMGWFRDIAVVAFPAARGDVYDAAAYRPVCTADPRGDRDYVVSGDSFEYAFAAPVSLASVVLSFGPRFEEYNLNRSVIWQVSVSDDGKTYRPHKTTDYIVRANTRTVSFAPVTTRFVRLKAVRVGRGGKSRCDLKAVSFAPYVRIPQVERKVLQEFYRNAFSDIPDVPFDDVMECPAGYGIDPTSVRDLSDRVSSDGTLRWDAPPGEWIVQRFAYYTRVSGNHPVNPEAYGLECDKLSRAGVDAALGGMTTRIMDEAKAGGVKSFQYTLIDSYEVGPQNWTDLMRDEFRRRKGYDLVKWLPVATGRYVGSSESSERFLEDFRSVVADLFAENYADYFAEVCHRKGLLLEDETYCGFFDYVRTGKNVDVPMGEFWHGPPESLGTGLLPGNIADVFGRKYVQTETFTSGGLTAAWTSYPGDHKLQGDAAYCAGVNRFVFHSYAHQPFDTPGAGVTMGRWGFHFNRHNTLWDFYPGWLDYLGRAQFLLQQGRGVADLVYALREDQPAHLDFRPAPPKGYRANGIDAGTFRDDLVFRDGTLRLPSGMAYRLLVVGDAERASAPYLEKVRALADAGAEVLLGPRPRRAFGLAGGAAAEATVGRLAAELWDGFPAGARERRFGRGRLWRGVTPDAVLAAIGSPQDFAAEGADKIGFIHRTLTDREIYFVANHSTDRQSRRFTGVFRAAGEPEFWNALDGQVLPVRGVSAANGLVRIPLELPHAGSVFVVFRKGPHPAPAGRSVCTFQPTSAVPETVCDLSRGWQVSFQPGRGAPTGTRSVETLSRFDRSDEFGIRHFSGTATFVKTFELKPDGRRLILELENVHDVAQVSVNGRDCVFVWTPPYRADVTAALAEGTNRLEIRVANRWMNRVIGDEHLPVDGTWSGDDIDHSGVDSQRGDTKLLMDCPDWFVRGEPAPSGRIAFSTARPLIKTDPLAPSGLEGYVRLIVLATE